MVQPMLLMRDGLMIEDNESGRGQRLSDQNSPVPGSPGGVPGPQGDRRCRVRSVTTAKKCDSLWGCEESIGSAASPGASGDRFAGRRGRLLQTYPLHPTARRFGASHLGSLGLNLVVRGLLDLLSWALLLQEQPSTHTATSAWVSPNTSHRSGPTLTPREASEDPDLSHGLIRAFH